MISALSSIRYACECWKHDTLVRAALYKESIDVFLNVIQMDQPRVILASQTYKDRYVGSFPRKRDLMHTLSFNACVEMHGQLTFQSLTTPCRFSVRKRTFQTSRISKNLKS